MAVKTIGADAVTRQLVFAVKCVDSTTADVPSENSGSPELPKFDAVLRESLSTTLNIDLSANRWIQASLPVRWGGLGVRSFVSLAPSAYLASAASTGELTTSLGVSMPWNLSRRLDAGLQKLATNHGQNCSCVSDLPRLFNAAMPPALLGH